MIRKAEDINIKYIEKNLGGTGITEAHILLNLDEFDNKGRMFNHVVLTPGSAVGYHTHQNECETYYFLKGQGTYDDNGTSVPIYAGDVTICKSGEGHAIYNTSNENLEFIALILFTN